MSNAWDIANVRKLAGLPQPTAEQLTESWDDDDEDPDVRIAMSDKRQREFEGKNKKHLDDNAEMLRKRTAEQRAAAAAKKAEEKKAAKPAEEKKEDKKPEEKKAEEKKAEEKKEDKPTEAEKKRRGAKPNESSKSGGMRAWLAANPGATRGQFIAAAAERGMSKHHANGYFYQLKKKSQVKEGYMLVHPAAPGYVLAENYELKRMQWVDTNSEFEPLFFVKEDEAIKQAQHYAEWNGQYAKVEKVVFED